MIDSFLRQGLQLEVRKVTKKTCYPGLFLIGAVLSGCGAAPSEKATVKTLIDVKQPEKSEPAAESGVSIAYLDASGPDAYLPATRSGDPNEAAPTE